MVTFEKYKNIRCLKKLLILQHRITNCILYCVVRLTSLRQGLYNNNNTKLTWFYKYCVVIRKHISLTNEDYFSVPVGQMRADVASQMQVAAATGQPLLAPAPIQSFVYPPGMNPQGYPQVHAVRMYESSPQIQYLQPNPSNPTSQAQPPQYNPGPGPQPPPQQYQPPPPQVSVFWLCISCFVFLVFFYFVCVLYF